MAVVKFRAEDGAPELQRFIQSVDGRGEAAVDDARCRRLADFAELVSTFGQRTDLVSARTVAALFEVLFVDALILAREDVIALHETVVDVGAGAGAPAIPLALLREDLSVTLVEPRRKRVAFMRSAVGSLGLAPRVKIIEGRDDAVSSAGHPSFSVAFSRATFSPEAWREIGAACGQRVITLSADEPPAGASHRVNYQTPSTRAPRVLAVFSGPPEA